MRRQAWAVAGLVFWFSATAGAVTIVLNPAADGHAGFSAYDGYGNGMGATIMTGRSYCDGSGTRVNRAINMRFDLSSIDSDSTVVSATLRLFQVSGDTGREVQVRQLISGSTSYTDADFAGSYNINTIASTASAAVVLAASSGRTLNAYTEWTGTSILAEVQAWVADPARNFGFRVENTYWQGETGAFFASKEGSYDQMPELVVEIEGAAGAHPGDANRDGVVDLQDFGALKDHFGLNEGAAWETGDFNGDSATDLQDFGILKDHFGHTDADTPVTAVPEPASVGVFLIALAGLRRRKQAFSPFPFPIERR